MGLDSNEYFIGQNYLEGITSNTVSFREVSWTPIGNQLNRDSDQRESDFYYHQQTTLGTDLERSMRSMLSHDIQNDMFIDNGAGTAIRDAIARLVGQYNFREPEEVKSFLCGNNTLRMMLSTIYSKIRKEFPSEKITLEVFSDSPHSSEKDMVVSVTTSLPVHKAIERLDKVENVRWDKDSKDPYVNICVELEYQ